MPTKLDAEIEYFNASRDQLLGRARGKFVLIKGNKLIDTFENQPDALKAGYERFGNEPFLVKQVLEVDVPQNFTSYTFTLSF